MPLIDPVFEITPNAVDSIRRSSDPAGELGLLVYDTGSITVLGQDISVQLVSDQILVVQPGVLQTEGIDSLWVRFLEIIRGSLTVLGMTDISTPDTLLNFTAITIDYRTIETSWGPTTETDWSTWRLEWGTDGFNFGSSATVTSGPPLRVQGLSSSTEWFFRIIQIDNQGQESLPSTVASATTSAVPVVNLTSILGILAGRAPHFVYNTPADPITTREVSVTTAAEFNTEASIAGTKINVVSSFTGNVEITADDIDVTMNNSLTISGSVGFQLGVGNPFISRIRWTGGNIGNIGHARAHDVLFDDIYALAIPAYAFEGLNAEHMFGYGNAANRLAVINSTLELAGDPSPPSSREFWALHTSAGDGISHGSDWFFGNVKVISNQQNNRFISTDNLMIVDSVFNPDGASLNGMRIHEQSASVWIKDSWSRELFKLDQTNTETTPSMIDGLFDNYDRYDDGSPAAYANYGPNTNTGTIQNSTFFGGTITYGTLINGGGNASASWDSVTVPDYSTTGANH